MEGNIYMYVFILFFLIFLGSKVISILSGKELERIRTAIFFPSGKNSVFGKKPGKNSWGIFPCD